MLTAVNQMSPKLLESPGAFLVPTYLPDAHAFSIAVINAVLSFQLGNSSILLQNPYHRHITLLPFLVLQFIHQTSVPNLLNFDFFHKFKAKIKIQHFFRLRTPVHA